MHLAGRNGDADGMARCDTRAGGTRRDARAHTQPHSTQLPLSARLRLKASSLGCFGVHLLASAGLPLFHAMQTLPMSVSSGSVPSMFADSWPVKILTGPARASVADVDPKVGACAGVTRASGSTGCNAYGPDGSFPLGETHGSLPSRGNARQFFSVVQL